MPSPYSAPAAYGAAGHAAIDHELGAGYVAGETAEQELLRGSSSSSVRAMFVASRIFKLHIRVVFRLFPLAAGRPRA